MSHLNEQSNLKYLQDMKLPNFSPYIYNNKRYKSATHALENYINEYYNTNYTKHNGYLFIT